MLHDLLSRAEVTNECVKLAVVQNFGLDKMVALQYRQTWVRVTMALRYSIELVVRNPVLSVRPHGWHTKSKIQVRLSCGIWSIGLRGFDCRVNRIVDISGCLGIAGKLGGRSYTHHATVKVCGED